MHKKNYPIIKRSFDFIVSSLLILLLCPVLIVIYILTYLSVGSPVIFRQKRPGKYNKIFVMYKFRTMKDERDMVGNLLCDDERITQFGDFLRKSSLDELPELFNVLKGEMSLVGPRPLLVEYLPLYSRKHLNRHNVRPGITGWAQVNGRNSLDWIEKFDLDLWYIDNMSFILDLKIIFLTIYKVIRRENISSNGSKTMSKFEGGSSK